MKRRYQKVFTVLFSLALMAGMFLTAQAADSSVIESVSVTLKSTFGEAEVIPEPEITISAKGCSLVDYQYGTDYEKWKPGKKVRIELTIQAEEGKYFPVSLTSSQCKISGANFVSARSLDENKLQVKVDYKPIMVLGDTERAGWNKSNKKKAVWKSVEYAPGYTLTLYGDGKTVKRLTVETNTADLSDYMEDMDKTYYYEVKAVPTTSEEKKYLKEGEYVASTEQEFDWDDFVEEEEKKQTPGDGGEFKGDAYIFPDGSRAKDTWKKVNGNWYYFDGAGNRVKGWLHTGDRWYYMDPNGIMQTGWLKPQGDTWYYLAENGEMQTGWVQANPGTWYYLGSDGRMQTGWLSDRGKWYHFAPDGHMQTGWLQLQDKWYYLTGEGHMQTGWVAYRGNWYYLNGQGEMAVNMEVDGWKIGADGIAHQ